MAKFLHLEFADGTVESYPIVAADIVKTERKYGQIGDPSSPSAEVGMHIAWCAATRMNRTALGFDEWLDGVAEMTDRPAPLARQNGGSVPSLPSPASTPAV